MTISFNRPYGRMSVEDVRTVKRMFAEGFAQRQIAKALKISPSHVSNIVHGLAHEYVPWPNEQIGSYEEAYGTLSTNNISHKQAAKIKSLGYRIPPQEAENLTSENLPPSPDEVLETISVEERKIQALRNLLAQEDELEELQKIQADRKLFGEKTSEAYELEASKETPKAFNIWDANYIPWSEILEKAPENRMVLEISQTSPEEDSPTNIETIQRAVQIVFKTLPQENWGLPRTEELIFKTYNLLLDTNPNSRENKT
jgi:transcriptional regulator with XRE-family HTH domain